MKRQCLIVNADDLGLTEGHNRAIVQAHTGGILTSASALACGPAFEDAVGRVRSLPALSVGVHLTLLEGTPILPPAQVPTLVRDDGSFGLNVGPLLRRLTLGRVCLEQVCREWRAQIARLFDAGFPVTHLDSHKHIHMHPHLLDVVLTLAAEFGIPRMRLSRPAHPVWGTKPAALGALAVWARRRAGRQGLRTPGALLGLEASGGMTAARMRSSFCRPWQGVRELMVHPAYPSRALDRLLESGYRWIADYRFEDELQALCADEIRFALDQLHIRLVSYEAL